MQNTLLKQLTKQDIIAFYKKGESELTNIGIEYERISIDTATFKQPDFSSLENTIKEFSDINGWELIYDKSTIIGAKDTFGSSISLEPGGQFEISLMPKKNLYEIQVLMANYIEQIDSIAQKNNIKFFAIGNNPKNTFNKMNILNKRRYKLMADYLPKIGKLAPVMMRETAGVQINIDYKNEFDAMKKLKAAALMSPFLTGFFANSPFRNNKLTKYKSIRALAWKFTGYDRCNLFYRDLINSDCKDFYNRYVDYILDVPMIFIERNNEFIPINGEITFKEFMEKGYKGYFATIEDYKTHQSLTFPDIRLKNCLEIRNHDSQNLEVAIGIAAIYKGIMYNDTALNEILDYLGLFTAVDLDNLGLLAARYGIGFMVPKLNIEANKAVLKILYLAQYYLNYEEQKYLDKLIDFARSKICIADLILENIK